MITVGKFFHKDPSLKVWFVGDFDNPVNGSVSIKDLSGNGFHGTPQNSDSADPNIARITSNWRSRDGLRIRASSSKNGPYFTFPVWNSSADNITMLVWFIFYGMVIDDGGDSGKTQALISTANNDTNTFLSMGLSAQTSNIRISSGGRTSTNPSINFFSKSFIYPRKVYCVAITKNNSLRQIYVNGVLENQITNDYTGYTVNSPMVGGQEGNVSPWRYHLNADILEIACFSRALSPSEISQYYNWAISNPKRNTLIIDPSLLYNPAISRRRLLLK